MLPSSVERLHSSISCMDIKSVAAEAGATGALDALVPTLRHLFFQLANRVRVAHASSSTISSDNGEAPFRNE
eukprot:5280000-Pleurochrysis_carterae.AAC.1